MKAKIIALLRSIRIDTLLLAIIATTSCLSYIETQYMKKQIRHIEYSLSGIDSSLNNIEIDMSRLGYIDSSLDNIESSISFIEQYILLR